MNALPWIVLFLPLAACAVITLFTLKDREVSARLSIGAVLAGFLSSVIFVAWTGWQPPQAELAVVWLDLGELRVDFGVRLDPLSLAMMLVVTGVGSTIHVYSYGYLGNDPGFSRYFAALSLFTFSMLGIVLATNLVQLFIFWELVGLSSYLLIGFWHERPAAADACKKAFLTNRVGDFGFLLGILVVWNAAGSLNFSTIAGALATNPALLGGLGTAAGLLIFCGAVGKSAQFPLHVWLPDAMEGPTPVSALIHAATMVAAGVYMLCRLFFLLNAPALEVIAWVGGATALLAAVIAIQQNDIKRILAYSTLSQLGYMVMAVGLSGPGPAMYHLTTHASFKALLFLGAGSVIVALHHEQDIWRMGGLRRKMPVTFWTFLIGTLALCGVPPLSGFFSKDEVLLQAYNHNGILFGLAVLVAGFTTLYMFRLLFVAFLGRNRSEQSGQAEESPRVMTVPLLLLAIPALLAGFWGIEHIFALQFESHRSGPEQTGVVYFLNLLSEAPAVGLFSFLAIAGGFSVAYGLYRHAERDPLPELLGGLARAMNRRFYLDEIYAVVIRCTQDALAQLANGIDRWMIAGFMVKGAHRTTETFGRVLRLVQTGNLQTYAFLFAAGAALLFYFALRN